MSKIMKTKYCSFKTGNLSEGCKLCVKGRKSVLFITGICPKKCFYCPISEIKKDKDVIYINELKTSKFKEISNEIDLCSSKGVGITGGDPLARISRTCRFIIKLKQKYGADFHIHLYTSLVLASEKKLKQLYDSGLDEIRFHPDLESEKFWNKASLFKKFNWDVGMEIPILPGLYDNTKRLILFVKDKVDFINLNELEYSDNDTYNERNYRVKDSLSYAIKGSLNLGKKLLNLCDKEGIPCHLCTAKLKDSVQLKNRMDLRLKNVKKWYDIISEDGNLIRGVIYPIKPTGTKEEYLKKVNLNSLRRSNGKIKYKTELDKSKKRILINPITLLNNVDYFKKKGLVPAIVKEYPTSDQFELEVDFL